ncbi:MAG: peptide ABC transporter permease [Gammaproteobacteria bacterium HGW-Gammaproteobacteria-10]|nr:MAG: peptide ABC transporter permease [Gammaproteobacteria bacterium HGW-Gammaproteobacteria-3]PKM36179.1 MAG: peptide ABC transporter permease [Gammaproteobacteria bacterium HGW-Gammaproteobacteria-10]
MIVLWTDALIFMLLIALALMIGYLRNKAQMLRPLRKIGQNKAGLAALTVLLFFVLIGLLDSVHFKSPDHQTREIISLLDYWATPIRESGEKTYSAPFAAHLYSKEFMIAPDGSRHWGTPRLKHGGAHLTNPVQQKFADIMTRTAQGLAKGAALYLFFGVLFRLWRRGRHKALFPGPASKTVAWVLFVIVTLTFAVIELSAHYHVLGTDMVGEDVLYQAVKSIRTGLVIGTLTTLIMLPLAIVFGILAGFFGGWIDDVIQYSYTTLNSIPGVLLIAASILMVQVYMANHPEAFTSVVVRADMRLLFLCIILGMTSWTGLCRLLRAETLKLREMEYVLAAQTLGVRQSRILFRHILPNVMHIVIISVVLDFSSLVLAEAVLSYINIGVDPATYSWGNMINGARLEMAREPVVWWSLTAAFLFMLTLVLAANIVADAVRDAFDPRFMDNA